MSIGSKPDMLLKLSPLELNQSCLLSDMWSLGGKHVKLVLMNGLVCNGESQKLEFNQLLRRILSLLQLAWILGTLSIWPEVSFKSAGLGGDQILGYGLFHLGKKASNDILAVKGLSGICCTKPN